MKGYLEMTFPPPIIVEHDLRRLEKEEFKRRAERCLKGIKAADNWFEANQDNLCNADKDTTQVLFDLFNLFEILAMSCNRYLGLDSKYFISFLSRFVYEYMKQPIPSKTPKIHIENLNIGRIKRCLEINGSGSERAVDSLMKWLNISEEKIRKSYQLYKKHSGKVQKDNFCEDELKNLEAFVAKNKKPFPDVNKDTKAAFDKLIIQIEEMKQLNLSQSKKQHSIKEIQSDSGLYRVFEVEIRKL